MHEDRQQSKLPLQPAIKWELVRTARLFWQDILIQPENIIRVPLRF
jgi:hypothetical protein